uniref:histidine kinase n=1 Tax=Tetraselmis astigmatica TaxID=1074897 RepID=A0A097CKH0_9CHLO|nr:phytochrome [Tetraselmis astigmatica]
MGDAAGRARVRAQDRQFLADVELEARFALTDGGCPASAQQPAASAGFNYQDSVEVTKAANSSAARGIPVSTDQLHAYDRRTLRPGQVQSFGALLLVGHGESQGKCAFPRGLVLAASANSKEVLGVEASQLLDTFLFNPEVSPFDAECLGALDELLKSRDLTAQAPLLATLRLVGGSGAQRQAFLIVHSTEEGYCIDVEPLNEDVSRLLRGSILTHSLAKKGVERLQEMSSCSVEEQCQALCEEARALTGYDRIMVYKFHPDCHGEVVAESVSEHVKEPMLGLHFPATDIPQANRGIFMAMRSRMIADTSASNVKILQSPRLLDNIILAKSQLRSVSGCHATYLQNMGSTATLTLSIVTAPTADGFQLKPNYFKMGLPDLSGAKENEGRPPPRSPLWGLVCCHHSQGPYRVNYDHRSAAEFLVKVFSLQLGRRLDALEAAAQDRVNIAQQSICKVLKSIEESPHHLEGRTEALADGLMRGHSGKVMMQVAEATGAAMLVGGKWRTTGLCPQPDQLDTLAAWLCSGQEQAPPRLPHGGRWGTISLHKEGFPNAKAIRGCAAGLLALDLSRSAASSTGTQCLAIWFRGELMKEQNWAGNKNDPQGRAMGHEMTPRSSFIAMSEILDLECRQWADCEVDGTHTIQLLLQDSIRFAEEGMTTGRILIAINQERLRNMDELTKVASELQSVILTADIPIIKLDTQLQVVDFNEHAKPFLQLHQGEGASSVASSELLDAHGKPLLQYIHPDTQAGFKAVLEKALATSIDPSPVHVKFNCLHPQHHQESPEDKLYLSEALVFVHLKHSYSGVVEGLVLVCRDMTTQQILMQEVVAREHLVEELSHHFASPMFCVDESCRINEWNTAMERLTLVEKSEVLGKLAAGEVFGPKGLLKCIASPDSPDAMTELNAHCVTAMQPPSCTPDGVSKSSRNHGKAEEEAVMESQAPAMELSFLRAGSAPKEVQISISCRPRPDRLAQEAGVYCFVQDLSLTKALEKAIAVQMAAEAAAQAKTRHIAFLCHEIRNPVNGILAAVHSMDKLVEPDGNKITDMDVEELQDLVSTTLACTDQLRRTVDGILDINKLEEGKLEVKESAFSISSVLHTVCSQVTRAASEKGLSLETQLDPPELGSMMFVGDAGRIQQILANFCWNSVKFTTEGFVRIVVQGEAIGNDSMRLFWKVVDSGKGMSQQTQERLFERFAMGDHQVGKYGGSGLGLSICRSLAELLNGHVHCVSALGEGSTFVLELSLKLTGDSADNISSVSASLPALQSAEHPSASNIESGSQPLVAAASPLAQTLLQQHPHPAPRAAASTGQWSFRVVREIVQESSVAVLVEVEKDGVVRQQWGGAQLGEAGLGEALAAATDDGMRNIIQAASPSGIRPLLFTGQPESQACTPAMAQPSASMPQDPTPSSSGEALPSHLTHVLVVDDDHINIKVMSRALTRGRLKITSGEDGEDIVRLCVVEGKRFDLVLVDANMRHMQGTTAIAALRQYERMHGLPPTPAIVTTGYASENDLLQYHSAGLNGLLTKPIDMRCVVSSLRNYCEFIHRFGEGHQPPNQLPWDITNPGYPPYVAADSSGLTKIKGCMKIGELLVFGAPVE